MAASTSSGLKQLISPQPDSNSMMPNTKPMNPLVVPSTTPLASELIRNLEKASLESNASSSPISSPSSLPWQFSMSVEEDIGKEEEEEEQEFESKKENGSSSIERNHGEERAENQNNRPIVINGKCYPPPISCLRKVMFGKPFGYVTYDEDKDTYVAEEIQIPKGSLFHASREDGRLKLSMNFLDEEEE